MYPIMVDLNKEFFKSMHIETLGSYLININGNYQFKKNNKKVAEPQLRYFIV
jgi:VCBS repeat-containing protein